MKRISKLLLEQEELASLGSVAAESAYLESTVDEGIKVIANLSDAQYEIFTAKTMLGTKLEMLHALGDLRIRAKNRKRRFGAIISKLKHLNQERSLAIHGLWEPVYDKGDGMTLHLYFLGPEHWPVRIGAKARNSKTKELSQLTAKRLDNLAEDLWVETMALHGFISEVWEGKRKRLHVARALARQRAKPGPR